MTGRYRIRIRNSRNGYDFELKRNITILCGDSGRGKTTLYDMIQEHNRYGKQSGVSVSCDKKIVALGGNDWESKLESLEDCIIVIDEDSEFIRSYDFARAVRGSDNYYLLITRNYLSGLPYSVDEIYEISGRKNKKFIEVYKETDRMYDNPQKRSLPFLPDVIITEDERAGFQFFRHIADDMGIDCVSANGKAKIYTVLKSFRDKNVVVIADGAAFGAEIRSIVEQQRLSPNKLAIFLPESFEWLILKSNAVDLAQRTKIEEPEAYADSKKYMSWEQYFTELLIETTRSSNYKSYSKEKLTDYYMQEDVSDSICGEIKGINFKTGKRK